MKTTAGVIYGSKIKERVGKKPQDGVNKKEIFTCPAQPSGFALTKRAFPKEFTAPAVQGWQLAAKLTSSLRLHGRLQFLISNLSE